MAFWPVSSPTCFFHQAHTGWLFSSKSFSSFSVGLNTLIPAFSIRGQYFSG
jgi:hypothetical protein